MKMNFKAKVGSNEPTNPPLNPPLFSGCTENRVVLNSRSERVCSVAWPSTAQESAGFNRKVLDWQFSYFSTKTYVVGTH